MWNDRRASEYLEQARVVKDILERQRLYRNFQVRFHDQLPALPLYYPVYNYGVSTDVKGVRIGPVFEPADRLETIGEWYFYFEVPGGQDGLTDNETDSGENQSEQEPEK
jgi:peptide/nickel transport system substrate-binding protein